MVSDRYGAEHRRLRRALVPAAAGRPCVRCGQPIRPGDLVDLDHDEHGGYLGVAHRRCNRAAAARKTNRARAAALRGQQRKVMTMQPTECVLGVEISQDRRRTAIGVASRFDSEPDAVGIDLAAYLDGTAGAVAELLRLRAELPVVAVVIDPHSQAATLLRPLAEAGVEVVEPSSSDVVIAHGTFMDELLGGRIRHGDHPALEAAARAAEQRRLGGASAWDRRVDVDVSPITAATLAVWALLNAPEQPEPQIFIG